MRTTHLDGDDDDVTTHLRYHTRLGFACRYLPDADLLYYLDRVSESALATGDIAGMIVEGSGEGGIAMLGSYVDRTADVGYIYI